MSTADGVPPQAVAGNPPTPSKSKLDAWIVYVAIAGVILPAACILIELLLGFCSSFFDPMPTPMHIILLCVVPISSLWTIIAYRRRDPRLIAPLAFAVGVALGVEIIYAIDFLPMVPFCMIAVIAYGLGLLGLGPYFALAATVVCSRRLPGIEGADPRKTRKALALGAATGIILLCAYIAPNWVTYTALRSASRGEKAADRAVTLIRCFGSRGALLRACYDLPAGGAWGAMLTNMGNARWSADDARTIYYRVTGDTFNSVPPPRSTGRRFWAEESLNWDSDVGGTAVNGLVRDLSLTTSRIDGNVRPDELTSYTEWTMEFTNRSTSQREARAEIALPAGAVVSRLTLWVGGEEREAAFSSRGRVRQAYEKVAVVWRQDPVLVTTCGPDRVLMQCFPVPPGGGKMKIRLGITAPLTLLDAGTGRLALPHFVQRNFAVPEDSTHSVYITSDRSIALGKAIRSSDTVRSDLSDEDLCSSGGVLTCERDPEVATVWTPDTLDPHKYAIVQTAAESQPTDPGALVIVIDSSRRMSGARQEIAASLKSLPAGCTFSVLQASDQVKELALASPATPEAIDLAADAIRGMRCAGGVDNRKALLQAYDRAAQRKGTILWIHGPQPLPAGARTERLVQLWERNPGSFRLTTVAAVDGVNSILADLDRTYAVDRVSRMGTLGEDLRRCFGRWSRQGGSNFTLTRRRVPIDEVVGKRGSSHVARLWARDEVARICRLADSRLIPETSVFAASYQIVTAISGAVVLENARQYRDAGLKPIDPKSAPSAVVPEPSSLLALGAGVAAVAAMRRKRVTARGSR